MQYPNTNFASQCAMVNADSNGGTDIEVVAAVTGGIIVVDSLMVGCSAATTSFFMESGSSTVIYPATSLPVGAFVHPEPGFKTASGEALTFSATITGTISVFVRYHVEK